MKIVVDTNIVVSGVFFKGAPRQVLTAIVASDIDAFATPEIVDEYREIIQRISDRGDGNFDSGAFIRFVADLNIIERISKVSVCRDPDDNKFIECAIDANAIYIVSGDKDLLDIANYEGVEIITASDFVERHLK